MLNHRLFAVGLALVVGLNSRAVAQDILVDHQNLYAAQIVTVGDVDADGQADFAVGAPYDGRGKIRIISGATQVELFRFIGDTSTWYLGAQLAAVGDVDQDGVPDLAASSEQGYVRVFSLGTRQALFTIPGSSADRFGYAVSAAGDVDGDGRSDIAVGAPQVFVWGGGDHYTITTTGPGFVQILSGANGSLLNTLTGPGNGSGFGGSLADGGDMNGDGVDDLLVSQYILPRLFAGSPQVRAFSGASGALLSQVPLLSAGARVTAAGDVDADGVGDLALSEGPLGVRLVSGATGSTLYTRGGIGPYEALGASLSRVGDFDGDGAPDLLAGAPQLDSYGVPYSPGPGYAQLISGRNGGVLMTLIGDEMMQGFGSAVSGLGDLDGDGKGEFVVSAGPDVRVYSSRPGFSSPTNYCIGDFNFSARARIGYQGSTSVAANQWTLTLSRADPGRLGVLFCGSAPTIKHFSATSQPGYLCVGAPTIRLGPAAVISQQGTLQRTVDLGPASPFAIGTTWYFQFAYYYNPLTRNTSDALAVTFTP